MIGVLLDPSARASLEFGEHGVDSQGLAIATFYAPLLQGPAQCELQVSKLAITSAGPHIMPMSSNTPTLVSDQEWQKHSQHQVVPVA